MRRYVLFSLALMLVQQPASAMVAGEPALNSKTSGNASPVRRTAKASGAALPANVSEHSKGVYYFKHKHYALAAHHLRKALELEPKNAMLHYYMANCFVHCRRHADAITEYKRSYELDSFGPVSGFCRQALLTYKVSLPDARLKAHAKPVPVFREGSPQNKVWSAKQSGRTSGVQETAAIEAEAAPEETVENEPEPKGQTVREHHLNNATAMIRRQTADEKARKKQYVDYISDNVVKTGQDKANRIKADAEEQIKELYEGPTLYDSAGNPRGRGVPSWKLSPTLQEVVKNRADQIRREADARAELELSISHEKSSEYKKWYMDRENDLDSVADSLETQLQQPSSRSGILLSPIGTGLYVRNYSSFKPKYPIPEAHSSVVRMLDRGFDYSAPSHEEPFKMPEHKRLEVSGSVID
jgi:tetratricopeptide (TPR) repeat protein